MSKRRGRSAWLVTWDGAGDHARVGEDERIAAVLHPRTGVAKVSYVMEYLYAAREFAAADKLAMLDENPYPVRYGTINVTVRRADGQSDVQAGPYLCEITCGHNPFLYARKVKNLRLTDRGNPVSGLVWDEIPRPQVSV